MPAPSLQQEVEQLVLEQICAFKQSAKMNDGDILEYRLRPYYSWALPGDGFFCESGGRSQKRPAYRDTDDQRSRPRSMSGVGILQPLIPWPRLHQNRLLFLL